MAGFTLLTGAAGLGFGGYALYMRGELDRELAFAICVSIFLANLEAVFVTGACTAPLAEQYVSALLRAVRNNAVCLCVLMASVHEKASSAAARKCHVVSLRACMPLSLRVRTRCTHTRLSGMLLRSSACTPTLWTK